MTGMMPCAPLRQSSDDVAWPAGCCDCRCGGDCRGGGCRGCCSRGGEEADCWRAVVEEAEPAPKMCPKAEAERLAPSGCGWAAAAARGGGWARAAAGPTAAGWLGTW